MPDQIDLSKMDSVVVAPNGHLRVRRHWRAPDDGFWDEIWKNTSSNSYWDLAQKGICNYGDLFGRHLSKGARVLEAGCGVGQVVLALRARGIDCHGLDFAAATIEKLNRRFPDVPFVQGDIRNIPYPDGFFDAYISLGVIEHFTEGQDKMVVEAARIVKPGGTIFLSVPAVNAYRRLRSKLGFYRKGSSEQPFFEDCYSLEEVKSLLSKAGFEYRTHQYDNTVMTFAQESVIRPLYRMIEDVRYVRGAVDRTLRLFLPRPWFGHMLMVVGTRK